MSGAGNFLARWSRRKRQAAQQPVQPKSSAAALETPADEATALELPLPPIESIDAATDLKRFLAPGAPASLTRAALRRAWTADPAIRNFIGLAENAWDFNAPDGVPGFGSLTVEEVQRLIAELAREPAPVKPTPPPMARRRQASIVGLERSDGSSSTSKRRHSRCRIERGAREGGAMKKEDTGKVGRRGFFRLVGAVAAAGAVAPFAREASADTGTNDGKRKARYRESDEVKAYYRVNRYPTK